MQLEHKNCGGTLLLDLKDFIQLVGYPSATKKGINIRRVKFTYPAKKINSISYVCEKCEKSVEEDDILVRCEHCGRVYTVEESSFTSASGGLVLCNKSCVEFYKERDVDHTILSLAEVLFRPNIKNSNSYSEHPALIQLEEDIERVAPAESSDTIEELSSALRPSGISVDGIEYDNAEEAMEAIRETLDGSVSERNSSLPFDIPDNGGRTIVRDFSNAEERVIRRISSAEERDRIREQMRERNERLRGQSGELFIERDSGTTTTNAVRPEFRFLGQEEEGNFWSTVSSEDSDIDYSEEEDDDEE